MTAAPLDHDTPRGLEAAGLRCTRNGWPSTTSSAGELYHPTAEEVFHAVRLQIPRSAWPRFTKRSKPWSRSARLTRLTVANGTGSARYDATQRRALPFSLPPYRHGPDLPTRFDPALISRLDPDLEQDLQAQGFQVTGYRLELVGYPTEPWLRVPTRIHASCEPSPATPARRRPERTRR